MKPLKNTLSKNLLEMKFMKKSKNRVEKEESNAQEKALFENDVTESMKKEGNKFYLESSHVPCEQLIIGRLSFRGMNIEIERLMMEEKGKCTDTVDVTEQQMAQRYSTLIGTIAKKFDGKKRRHDAGDALPQKRPRFLKPKD